MRPGAGRPDGRAARLGGGLDSIHVFQRLCIRRDLVGNLTMDIDGLYACLAGSSKHVGTAFSDPEGSAGQARLTASCAPMHRFCGLPGEAAAGMHATLPGFSFAERMLGEDLLGQMLRYMRGIEVTEEAVRLETMRAAWLRGPEHDPGSDQTLALMQTEYVDAAVGNRMSPRGSAEAAPPDQDRADARRAPSCRSTRPGGPCHRCRRPRLFPDRPPLISGGR